VAGLKTVECRMRLKGSTAIRSGVEEHRGPEVDERRNMRAKVDVVEKPAEHRI